MFIERGREPMALRVPVPATERGGRPSNLVKYTVMVGTFLVVGAKAALVCTHLLGWYCACFARTRVRFELTATRKFTFLRRDASVMTRNMTGARPAARTGSHLVAVAHGSTRWSVPGVARVARFAIRILGVAR